MTSVGLCSSAECASATNPRRVSDGVNRRFSAALFAATVLFAGCNIGEPDLAALQRDAAASIRYADSVELAHFFEDKRSTLEGPQSAFDSRVFGTQATDEDVRAYYDAQLR